MGDLTILDLEALKRKKALQTEITEAVKVLFKYINFYGSHDDVVETVLEAIKRDHPTLQQDFWRMMFDVMKQYGEFEYFDGRNEQAVGACRVASHATPNLPRI